MEKIKHCFLDMNSEYEEVDKGVFRKILSHNDNLMICKLHFLKGAVGTLHTHVHEQATYILSGKFEFTIGEEKYVVGPNDSLYEEPNIIHGVVCLEEGELLDIFTPERKDFLKF